MSDDFHERWLQANAQPEMIYWRFADVLRNLMRAVANQDPARPLSVAAQEMNVVSDLIQRCEEPINWYRLFSQAVEDIQGALPDHNTHQGRYVGVAQDGIKFLVESSAADNAARGRASRRLSEFQSAIQYAQASLRGLD